ncbi:mas-related G-protein coupled receptor member B5-like [Zonotrichia leucophrys gambelii]|uniref:mas-related G-protein coupled receptor member B5-like n=1 Tax=Zonotrichia leucophrys gambelii TaxID=257770 RepID=UPI003140A134
MSCSPIMPLWYLNFFFQLSVISCYLALFQLIPISNVLYMYTLCWLCCHCDLPKCLWLVVGSVQYWAFFALFAVIPTLTFLCPSHQQELCRAALISVYTIALLLFVVPVVTSRTIVLMKAKWGSQQQQPKRRDIVILITVLLTLFLSLWNFLKQLGYLTVPFQVVFLLNCIHSSIKPFIYFLAGQCWWPCPMGYFRLSLQRVFEQQKKKKNAEITLAQKQQSEPVDPFHCSAEGPWHKA